VALQAVGQQGFFLNFRHFIVILSAALIASCATRAPPLQSGPHLTLAPGGVLPPPSGQTAGSSERAYRIGSFDKLAINVFGVPELSMTVQADASGRISLPLAGVVEAAGHTPEELATEIAGRLRTRYIRDPQVTVNLEETVSQVVTIDGQVGQPGLYPVVGRMTLMRAIATARGTTEFARLSDVVVFRTVGEQRYAALYNLQAIRRGTYPDPEIYADDVVVVGDSPARRLFRDILQAAPLLLTPVVAILQNSGTN
jgi:polysaccharide export outer membrane protein